MFDFSFAYNWWWVAYSVSFLVQLETEIDQTRVISIVLISTVIENFFWTDTCLGLRRAL